MSEVCEKWCPRCLATRAHTMKKGLWACDKCQLNGSSQEKEIMRRKKISEEQLNAIKERRAAGVPIKDLAREFSVSIFTLYGLLKGVKPAKVVFAPKPKIKQAAEEHSQPSNIRDMIEQIVDARVSLKLAELDDARILEAVRRLLK